MSHKTSHYHEHDAPHESMVGAIIALAVVSIVLQGIAPFRWWVSIIQVVLAINMIKEIIYYLTDDKARKSYHYSTTGEDLMQIWIATIIVSIIMNWIFPNDPWYAQIAPTVLSIKAIEITILFFVTKAQNSKLKHHHHIQTHGHLYGHSSDALPNPTIQVSHNSAEKNTQTTSLNREIRNYSSLRNQQPADIPSFCPMCGERHSENDRFCPNCGANLN